MVIVGAYVRHLAEALEAGVPPKVKLAACEESALEIVNLEDLKKHQIEDV